MDLEALKVAAPDLDEAVYSAIMELHSADVAGLKKNNAALVEEKRQAVEKLAAFDGVDVNEYTELKKGKESGKTDIQRLTEQVTALQESLAKKDEESKSARQKAADTNARAELLRAIEKSNGIPDALLNNLSPMIRGLDNNGAYGVEVLDKDGKPRFDESGNPFTVEALLKEHSSNPDNAWGYKSSGLSGAGAPKTSGRPAGKSVTRNEWDSMDHAARADFSKNGGKVTD